MKYSEKIKKRKIKKSKKSKNIVLSGGIYSLLLKVRKNNSFAFIIDGEGNLICWSSAGSEGYKNKQGSTPYAAFEVGKSIALKAKQFSIEKVRVIITGLRKNYKEMLRAIFMYLQVISVSNNTPIVFNGTRVKRRRRT